MTWASPASRRSRAACSRTCTAGVSGRCASTPGFGTAEESNERYRYLLAQGQTGLSVAFDLPTQMGRDSDDPKAQGEVGRVGVAIDSIDDMRTLLRGLPLDKISTSMTINATAAILFCLYMAVAEESGVPRGKVRGTIQNDILKEYMARGTYIYPPRPSIRLITDIFAFCGARGPEVEHDLDQRLPHPRGGLRRRAGGRVHAGGRHRVREAALDAGLDVDAFGAQLSFFFNVHNNLIEEVAKFRAARRHVEPRSCTSASARRPTGPARSASTARPPA